MKKITLSLLVITLLSNSLLATEEPSFFQKAKEKIKSSIPDSVKEKLGMESTPVVVSPPSHISNVKVDMPKPIPKHNSEIPDNLNESNQSMPNPGVPNPVDLNKNTQVQNVSIPERKKTELNPAKKMDQDLEAVKMLLQTKSTIPDFSLNLDESNPKDRERIKRKNQEEVEKLLLPEPFKSMKVGSNVIVYAKIKEKVIKSNSGKSNDSSTTQSQDTKNMGLGNNINSKNPLYNRTEELIKSAANDFSENDMEYKEKEIKLKKGMTFYESWSVHELKADEISFENIKTKEIVKKYF